MTVLVDIDKKSEELPEFDESARCPKHPDLVPVTGYGLAGGGIGPYTFCEECGRVLTKSADPQE